MAKTFLAPDELQNTETESNTAPDELQPGAVSVEAPKQFQTEAPVLEFTDYLEGFDPIDYGAIADPTAPVGDITNLTAQQFPAQSGIKQVGKEAKAIPVQIGKGAVRFTENILLGGPARLERILGELTTSFSEEVRRGIGDELADEGMIVGPVMRTIDNIADTLTKHGSETSEYWKQAANTGWEAVEENSDTPVAKFIGQTSEATYSSAIMLAMAYMSGGQTATTQVIQQATKLSAQSKAIIATFSALGASSSYEQIKDADGTTLEALNQFGLQTAIEYFGETTAFGDVFKGEAVGVGKLALNSMLEEGGVGFAQDVASTFHVARLEGDSIEDSYKQALDVAYRNLPQNTAGGAIGATTIGTVNRGVVRYKNSKYTNLVNSAEDADNAIKQLQETAAKVKANPAEFEASITPVVHTMPDGSTMPGPEHEGSVPNSARQVSYTSEEVEIASHDELKQIATELGFEAPNRYVEDTLRSRIHENLGHVSAAEIRVITNKELEAATNPKWMKKLNDSDKVFADMYVSVLNDVESQQIAKDTAITELSKLQEKSKQIANNAPIASRELTEENIARLARELDAPLIEDLPNPYLNPDMDILRVLADAEHGVALAEQAVMQRIDELQYFEEDYNKALQPQSKKPIKSTAAEIGDVETKPKPKPKPIKNVKIKGLEDDAGKKVLSNLRAISGSNSNFIKLSNLANSLGGVPTDLAMRQSFINDLTNVAKTQNAFQKKSAKLKAKDKRLRIFNPWVESRYSLAEAEQITGKPFRRLYLNMIGKSNVAADEVSSGMLESLQSAGIKKGSIILNRDQANAVSDYLFEEIEANRGELFTKLDDRSKNVVRVLDDLLQGPIANEIRQVRWYKWNDQYKSDILKVAKAQIKAAKKGKVITEEEFDKLMKRSTDLIPRNVVNITTDYDISYNVDGSINPHQTERNRVNAATQILKDGITANEQGQLRDWITSQPWGTRAHYYMSEGRVSDLVDYVDSATVKELTAETPTKAGKLTTDISATETRKGQARKKGSRTVIRDVMQHWERAAAFNAAHDDLVSFWDNFDSAIAEHGSENINPKDVENIRKLLGTVIAKPAKSDELSEFGSKLNNAFWTAYFADISRSGRFAVRNLKQNIAYLGTELSVPEMAKALGRMATGQATSAQELTNFEEFWKTEISQKRQMFNHFIMSAEASQTEVLGHNLSRLTNSLGSLAMRSDEANRKVAWKMAYEISTHNLDLYNQGKISYKQLESRLKISTFNTSERLELKGLLNTSNSDGTDTRAVQEEFIKRYTSMKTMNTHFGYDLKHKAIVEQNPGARAIIGPATYFRGRAQIINQSIIKPLKQAGQTGNWKQGKEAISNLLKFIIGTSLAGKAAEKMGYEAYGLVSDSIYTPASPGVSMALEASQEIDYIISQAGDEVDFETSATRIADVIGGLAELGVPMLNTMSQLYQAQNDVRGVTTMKRVQNILYEQGWKDTEKRYQDMDRNLYEKIGNVLWGGFDKEETD